MQAGHCKGLVPKRRSKATSQLLYELRPSADTTGVTGMGELDLPPRVLVQRFGPPSPGDGSKVSGEYVFVGPAGEVFVVHDWKATSLWNEAFPTPQSYWSLDEAEELVISSRDMPTEQFEVWLPQQLQK